MSLLDTLRKNLNPELFASVTDALGDDFNYDLVPRSRLNKVIGQRDSAREELARLTQGDDGADPDGGDEGDEGDGAGNISTQQQKKSQPKGISQKDLDKAVQKEREAGEAKMKDLQLKFAATEKLREAKFADPDLVLSANLIDFTKVTTDESGKITGGLDDQIKAISEARPYLITNGAGNAGAANGTGKNGGADDFGSITSREEFMKLPTDKQVEFKKANPEVFKGFMTGL
jgi:hypothetical protein